MVCSLVSICFDSRQLGYKIKTNCIKLYTIDPEICLTLNFQKMVWDWLVCPLHFVYDFSRKLFYMLCSIH